MPAVHFTQEQIDRLAAEGRAMLREERGDKPPVANQTIARQIPDDVNFVFRGKKLRVRPLPFEDGLKLMELAALVEEIVGMLKSGGQMANPGTFVAYRTILVEILTITHNLLRPRFVPRFLWRFRPNIFRKATQQEVLEILRFCGRCQMISPGLVAPGSVGQSTTLT